MLISVQCSIMKLVYLIFLQNVRGSFIASGSDSSYGTVLEYVGEFLNKLCSESSLTNLFLYSAFHSATGKVVCITCCIFVLSLAN